VPPLGFVLRTTSSARQQPASALLAEPKKEKEKKGKTGLRPEILDIDDGGLGDFVGPWPTRDREEGA